MEEEGGTNENSFVWSERTISRIQRTAEDANSDENRLSSTNLFYEPAPRVVNLPEWLSERKVFYERIYSKSPIFSSFLSRVLRFRLLLSSPPSSYKNSRRPRDRIWIFHQNPRIRAALRASTRQNRAPPTEFFHELAARLCSSKLSSLKRRKISPFRGLEKENQKEKKKKRNGKTERSESRVFDALKVSLIGKARLSRKFSELNTKNVAETLKGTDKKSN